jgi:hypothetical protein
LKSLDLSYAQISNCTKSDQGYLFLIQTLYSHTSLSQL